MDGTHIGDGGHPRPTEISLDGSPVCREGQPMIKLLTLLLAVAIAGCTGRAPAGGALTIDTASAYSPQPGAAEVCEQAIFEWMVVGRTGDRLTFTGVTSGHVATLIWPHGFTARVIDDKGALLDPFGIVIGREGDTIADLGGGGGRVCSIGGHIYG
jgi:hypothetical protein